ncbi:MAG: transglutaminase family protein [Burkholderiaceae bacterium]|nr:transglutaminase family protein [Burkholderiaceae bacterium]
MPIHVALHHVTTYRYDQLITLGPQVIRLRPAPHCRTRILSYALRIEPAMHFLNWQQDPFANYLARVVIPEKTRTFEVVVDLVAEIAVYNPFDFFLEPGSERFPFSYSPELKAELAPYLVAAPMGPQLTTFFKNVPRRERRSIDFLVELNSRVHRKVGYTVRMEPGVQTPEETLSLASGSCRDSGWLLVQLFRHFGLAARFVSGYLIQLKPDVEAVDGPSGATEDFTDLHAWCEVYLPGAGWVGLDPTSGLLAGEGHIPIACTPEPSSAAPISGALEECEVEFVHQMTAQRVHETPRVTKPYSDAQWESIGALGGQVDARLEAQDVRLTMGGEPTFVSALDRDGAEWNTDALGPTKRGLGLALMHRLQQQYGATGFLHFGQGKWYPGEQLPRWTLSAYWRTDGQPCWKHPELFADEREPHFYTTSDAHAFLHAVAGRLGVSRQHIQAGYEDTFYYLWKERTLPINVDPFDSKLNDEMERARLRRVFEHRLDEPVGYALPLTRKESLRGVRSSDITRWESGVWYLRDARLYLLPGDSPMGYRLPLDSLPWALETDRRYPIDRDPFDKIDALDSVRTSTPITHQHRSTVPHTETVAPAKFESHANLIRTALCVEVRNPNRSSGPKLEFLEPESAVLYVFMPPLTHLEDYLALLQIVEETALQLDVCIVLEGYPPPRDARMMLLQVTPDPGVLEVNIHPAKNWSELVQHTEFLYQAAHETRLSCEKFMVDGRHTGTGGGNHFVMGAASPADSPFLRRPDVLASLLTFWHNHPSMSYLFSGLFVGPTSQSPRVDEARNDQVYELEIALKEIDTQMKRPGGCSPWMIDRALRNILIDVTGNTHRAEFSIDKLYSPDGPSGRLGLLELRGFEMPPHARMSLVQQLLIRALVAWFWKTTYRPPGQTRLTRWGTQLHDRFMLPTFILMDFQDVLSELQAAGFHFDMKWFAPHAEFRFPLIGETDLREVRLSLRTALEPWHVMGEESGAGGTVRLVDASVERLELKVSGYVDNRFSIAINGVVPRIQPTGTEGEYVIGVRYRAWSPPSALHPTIGVHAPLTFDLVDNWLSRSMGGCRYHVTHPGGRSYDTLPVNAFEAESRRLARFSRLEHTPGSVSFVPHTTEPEFPYTLDLRRHP